MRVVFLGVGEAFDERLSNTSILIRTEEPGEKKTALLDCGFTAATAYWKHAGEREELDALWVSHFHGDHFFGAPALLLRFWESKRKKPLTIIGQTGIEETIRRAMDLAYPNFLGKLGYPLEFIPVEPGTSISRAGFNWTFAENDHSRRDLAVRIESDGKTVFYSGDGVFTKDTLALARGCDLVIHEAFMVHDPIPGHGSVVGSIGFAREARALSLALVHLQRDERRRRFHEIHEIIDTIEDVKVLLPEPGDELEP